MTIIYIHISLFISFVLLAIWYCKYVISMVYNWGYYNSLVHNGHSMSTQSCSFVSRYIYGSVVGPPNVSIAENLENDFFCFLVDFFCK